MTAVDARSEESWDDFVEAFRRLVPVLTGPLYPDTTLASLLSSDRIQKGLVSAAVTQLLYGPPDDMVAPETTLKEVHEWRIVRSKQGYIESASARGSGLETMQTRNVRLRPVLDSDIPDMYASAIDPRWSYRWRYRGTTPSLQDFAARLYHGVLCQFIIERRSDERAIGQVSCYNARADLGWAYIAFGRISSIAVGKLGSEMLEGGYLFVSLLFRNWEFRKLYAEVTGWNWHQFEHGMGEFFSVEGVLKAHDYFDGRYWDQRIVALYRSKWETEAGPLLQEVYG